MNYKYRVYNAITGHEYADVDSRELAELVRDVLFLKSIAKHSEITIDVLVAEVA